RHRVADARHGLAHKSRHVVHHGEVEGRRNGGTQVRGSRFDLVGDLQNISADLTRDADERARLAISKIQNGRIHVAVFHLADVAQPDGGLIFGGDDGVPDIVEACELAGGKEQVPRVALIEPADRLNVVRRAQPVGDVHERKTLGHHLLRVNQDGNFPDVARLDLDLRDARYAAEDRAQVVVSIVAQVGARNAAGQDHHQDGPGAWRDALDRDVGDGGKVAARLAGRRLRYLPGILHVRVGGA